MSYTRESDLPKFVTTVLVAALAIVVAGCIFAIAPAIWTAMKDIAASQAEQDPRACLTIKNEADRLKCLETRVGRNPPPARGAYAPLSVFRGRDSEAR